MTPSDHCLLPVPKLRTLAAARIEREQLRQTGRTVVLTNGCFDLLHPGHVFFLQQAAALGDALFIALNSDASVRALKGPSRPVLSETERAYTLAALACVHTLVIFHQPRLVTEIETLRPDRYVKAGDYTLESLDRSEFRALQHVGAQIQFLPFLPGVSTTDILHRLGAAQA